MIIPAAMDIYSAQDALKNRPQSQIDRQLKEMRCASAAKGAADQASFEAGYLLGLETIRTANRGMVKAVLALSAAGLTAEKDLA